MAKTTNPKVPKPMQIKIQAKTRQRIEDALKVVNGRAERHAFTTFREVVMVAMDAEIVLDKLGVLKADRPGTTATMMSGSKLPGCYKYNPIRTVLSITRRAAGWYVTGVAASSDNGATHQPRLRTVISAGAAQRAWGRQMRDSGVAVCTEAN